MGSAIIAFPLYRRGDLVSNLASILQSKHGDSALLFWRETAKELLRQLAQAGVPAATAEEQVRVLLYAVLAEIEADAIKERG